MKPTARISFAFWLMAALSAVPAMAAQGAADSRIALTDRDVAAMRLGPETTLEQLSARWGEPFEWGPNREMLTYSWGGNGEQRDLWLSFDAAPPRRLRRALLLRYKPRHYDPQVTVLFDTLRPQAARRWEQLDFAGNGSPRVRAGAVLAAWGPPDSMSGLSGNFWYWTYHMANGDIATLRFMGGFEELEVVSGYLAQLPRNRRRAPKSRSQ